MHLETLYAMIKVKSVSENLRPLPEDPVKVLSAGKYTEILFNSHKSHGSVIKKIDKDTYLDTRSGELKPFQHNHTRAEDLKSVSRSLRDLRNLINANVTDPSTTLFLTLTYRENMQDTKKVYNDFQNFRKRFYNSYKFDKWIAVLEPQARGAWHLHILLIFNSEAPFIDNSFTAKQWKQGFTNTRAVSDVDNVGAYLSAYLSDLTLEEAEDAGINTNYAELKDVEIPDEHGNKIPKKVIKGGRLGLYPAGTRIWRCSRNCERPEVYHTTNEQAENNVIFDTLTYEVTKNIEDTETGFSNTFNRRVYVST